MPGAVSMVEKEIGQARFEINSVLDWHIKDTLRDELIDEAARQLQPDPGIGWTATVELDPGDDTMLVVTLMEL